MPGRSGAARGSAVHALAVSSAAIGSSGKLPSLFFAVTLSRRPVVVSNSTVNFSASIVKAPVGGTNARVPRVSISPPLTRTQWRAPLSSVTGSTKSQSLCVTTLALGFAVRNVVRHARDSHAKARSQQETTHATHPSQ